MTDAIALAPPDPEWPRRFEEEAARCAVVLAPLGLVACEHIGSTAVPGLVAKPVIDLMAGFASLARGEELVAALEPLGYLHWREDPQRGERLFFVRGLHVLRTHHLHATVHDARWWRDHVRFRDRLRASPQLAAEYAELKRELAARFRDDREAYTDGKAPFVARVLAE